MTDVKPDFPVEEWHAPLLMGMLFREVAQIFEREDWHGLRQSHFRVISGVPPDGISVTELGDRVRMSKQGCGQFVTTLVESGHLRVLADPRDRRVRLVRRTAKGNRTITAVTKRMLQIEDDWAARVGRRRYDTFRRVLEELAQPAG
jgi:DNA-binding MarR family transcriptional regulator